MILEGNGFIPWWAAVVMGVIISLPLSLLWGLIFNRKEYEEFDSIEWASKEREEELRKTVAGTD